ncbi:MAG: DUF309 domain-containing protein [Planctomycetaceae bacterium]|nr:DUF309 domain-containing protein [Planctomycetaceae bacterium]MCA9030771.1 DUF309 domain-containing protein [Planctomycetaceae bacterium]MCA9043970.1 DUF309 domain-containing protein [Planctomycetaceae bacterium]MCB9950313.1 DUF309 domain-containing protein [Planctomycetaceae bacterium]
MHHDSFAHAVELFNEQEFFACHDVLEEIWNETLDERRDFYQGLIHAAVALFHFSERNLTGARKMHASTLRYLAPYGEAFHDIDLQRFRQDFNYCFRKLTEVSSGYPHGVEIDMADIPVLITHRASQ